MSPPRSTARAATVVIRPSIRLIRPFYTLSFLLLAVAYGISNNRSEPLWWLLIFPVLLLLWTVWRHVGQHFSVLVLENGKLRYQTGVFSRTTRTLDAAKVQDVQVTQSLIGRLIGIGNISIETAGDRSPMTLKNIDRPQAVADYILEIAGKQQ